MAQRMATGKQMNMLQRLFRERTWEGDAAPYELKKQISYAMAVCDGMIENRYMTVSRASALIGAMLELPYANGTGSNRTITVDFGALEEGFYAIGDEVFRIVPSRRDPSRKFAEKLDTETGRFRYEKGAIFRVAEKGKMITGEMAAELGKKFGICIRCGAELTVPESIERGMGPVCAKKW